MSSSTAAASTPTIAAHPAGAAMLPGALGVVFGDIGASVPTEKFLAKLRRL